MERQPGPGDAPVRRPTDVAPRIQVANRSLAGALQAKLEVGPAGDRYEQEADRVARAVVAASPAARLQRQGPEEEELQMSRLQRASAPVVGAAGGELDHATEAAIARAGSGGRPLDSGLQREMESSFGADFSGVRVHTGPATDALNSSMQARAFTTGSDVFVRSGDYRPETSGGRELLAHELTHVVQQGAAPLLRENPSTT